MTSKLAARQITCLLLLISAGLGASSCAATGQPGQASSFVIVDSLLTESGLTSLASDVASRVNGIATVLEDVGVATFRLAMKDPTITGPSNINHVTLKGYRVTFTRSDGRNRPGVDVPYAFDGAMTATVGEGRMSVPMVLVRGQAKQEAPLRALAGGGGALTISTFADVVFYGTDQAGHEVTANARISVTFADWGDVG